MSQDDLELLMMLMDGALAPADAALLRARIADEPELASTWNELQQMQLAIAEHLSAAPAPDFTQRVMAQVRQTEQLPPSLWARLEAWLSRPIAIPLAAAAALAVVYAIGLPEPSPPPELSAPVAAKTPAVEPTFETGETEIESIDNETDYNVLVLAAPGSSNRMIWLSRRDPNEEG